MFVSLYVDGRCLESDDKLNFDSFLCCFFFFGGKRNNFYQFSSPKMKPLQGENVKTNSLEKNKSVRGTLNVTLRPFPAWWERQSKVLSAARRSLMRSMPWDAREF